MRRKAILVVALVAAGALAAVAWASSVHLKPPNRPPTFVDQGLVLEATGNLAGLGNGDILISLTAQADVTASCANNGQHQAPGQNPAPITVTGSQAIPEGAIQNGNVAVDVLTNEPVTPIAGAPDCPNPNWTEAITDLAFTSATIVVEQPVGTTVLTVNCTLSPATSNGTVPRSSVSCTSS